MMAVRGVTPERTRHSNVRTVVMGGPAQNGQVGSVLEDFYSKYVRAKVHGTSFESWMLCSCSVLVEDEDAAM